MFGRKKKEKSTTGFWAEVRELNAAIEHNVAAGRGSRSLIEAVKTQDIRKSAVKAGVPSGVQQLLDLANQSPGQQVKVSSKEYRRLMGLDP